MKFFQKIKNIFKKKESDSDYLVYFEEVMDVVRNHEKNYKYLRDIHSLKEDTNPSIYHYQLEAIRRLIDELERSFYEE